MVDRREFLKLAGATAALALAGCSSPQLSSNEVKVAKDVNDTYQESSIGNAAASGALVLASKISKRPLKEIEDLYKTTSSTFNAEAAAILVLGSIISGANIEELEKFYQNQSQLNSVANAYLAAADAIETSQLKSK